MIAQIVHLHRSVAARIQLGLVLTLLLLAVGSLPGPASATEIVATGARIGGDATRTRFVADLTQAIGFTVYVLPDPYRVMIDLPAIRFDLPPDAGRKTQGLITEFRYGEVEEEVVRVSAALARETALLDAAADDLERPVK